MLNESSAMGSHLRKRTGWKILNRKKEWEGQQGT
jgi:hypothetical protein